MKFTVSTSGYFYADDKQRKNLEELGFKFGYDSKYGFCKLLDKVQIEITSLNELISFIKKYGEIVISETTIEIYDNYRE